MILYTLACLIKAFDVPAHSAMMFKLIPTERLGKLGGIAGSVQFIGMTTAGLVITKINITFEEPINIAVMFLSTFVISVLMSILLFTIEEPENKKIDRSPHFIAFLGKCTAIIKTDRVFTKFIIGKWLMSGHHIMMAFILAYLINIRLDSIEASCNQDRSNLLP